MQTDGSLFKGNASAYAHFGQNWHSIAGLGTFAASLAILTSIFGALPDLHSKLFGQSKEFSSDMSSNVSKTSLTRDNCHPIGIF